MTKPKSLEDNLKVIATQMADPDNRRYDLTVTLCGEFWQGRAPGCWPLTTKLKCAS